MSEIQFLIGRRPMRSYSSWDTRHHCPMEVAAYGINLLFALFLTFLESVIYDRVA